MEKHIPSWVLLCSFKMRQIGKNATKYLRVTSHYMNLGTKLSSTDSNTSFERRYFRFPKNSKQIFTNLLKTWCVKNLEVLLNGVLRMPLVSSPIPSAISSFNKKKESQIFSWKFLFLLPTSIRTIFCYQFTSGFSHLLM